MQKKFILLLILITGFIVMSCNQTFKNDSGVNTNGNLIAKPYNSGFSNAHTTYNAISTGSDGKIYYVLSTTLIDTAAQMYSFDPQTLNIERLADLSEICGEKNMKTVAQGKSHVEFYESKGKLYFGTHLGYYDKSGSGGKEQMSTTYKDGYSAYQGAHLISFDMQKKTFEDLGTPVKNEGILTMKMDTLRGLIYGLSWPTGYLFRYNIDGKKVTDLGAFTGKGEDGTVGKDFRVICRSIVLNEDDGTIYLSNAEGLIKELKVGQDSLKTIQGADFKKDYFGTFDVTKSGNMAYNWRQAFWYAPEKVVYGVHGNSGYLFRFDPGTSNVEVLDRLTSLPSKRSGMNDLFGYGYLGFELGPDGHTIYYFTGSPVAQSGSDTSLVNKVEDLHLITYDISKRKYSDHGLVVFPNGESPRRVQSITIAKDGTVYGLGNITENGKTRADLFSIPNPLNK